MEMAETNQINFEHSKPIFEQYCFEFFYPFRYVIHDLLLFLFCFAGIQKLYEQICRTLFAFIVRHRGKAKKNKALQIMIITVIS